MGWCRQCCALMRKNRIIKCRLWGSTLAEILLPVLIMLIMVGLRAAVTKDDTAADLHYKQPVPLSQAQIDAFKDNNWPIVNGTAYDENNGPTVWDGDSLAEHFFIGDKNQGVRKVNTIQFVPNTLPEVLSMAEAFRQRYPILSNNVQTRFESEAALEDYVKGDDYATSVYDASIAYAIVVNKNANRFNLVLRGNMSQSQNSMTTIATDVSSVNTLQVVYDKVSPFVLLTRGHHLLQDFAEEWLIRNLTNLDPAQLQRSYSFQPFPTPPYVDDPFADVISSVLGLFFTIIWMWPVTRLVKGIVEEKQLRIREGMKMMGLPDSAIFCSWIGTYTIIFIITSVLITIVTSGSVYEKSNKFYIFIFFFLFSMASFAFCWLVSVFFSRSQVATTFAALIFLAIFFPYFAVEGASSSASAKQGASILAPVCFGLGAVVIQNLESSSNGVNSDTGSIDVDNFNYNTAIGMFIVDFFLYMILALYFQQVIPSEWGTHQKPWFFLLPSYWCPEKVRTSSPPRSVGRNGDDTELSAFPHHALEEDPSAVSGGRPSSYYFEPVSEAVKENLGVSIQDLRKTFKTEGQDEPFVAVKKLNLDLYTGQIVALLGHNGAGKTTTINMLCGMIGPTSGDAYVFGSSITDNMTGVRKVLGVCPQHDILYDLLTVQEHLELFAAIKDIPSEEVQVQIADMIAQVGLTEKVHDKSAALSGGMRRKLSVGIALLGDSKIVFLDEPTSGMDPYSRRATWDLLKKKKEGRVIILTTHFMDEADQLGDRIAIMAKGEVKCCGSSLFLKGRYGVGYTLTLVKDANFNQDAVTELIASRIPDTSLLSNIAGEISFRLPFQSSPHFADVFDQFDFNQDKFGITSYGISVTTLEEVFLRVGHEEEASPEAVLKKRQELAQNQQALAEAIQHPHEAPQDVFDMPDKQPELIVDGTTSHSVASPSRVGGTLVNVKASPRAVHDQPKTLGRRNSSRFAQLRIPKGENMFARHFRALLMKRWWNAKRDRKVFTWTLLYPFLILLIGVGLITLTSKTDRTRIDLTTAELNQGTDNFIPVVRQSDSAPNLFAAPPAMTQFQNVSSIVPPGAPVVNMSQYLLDELYPTPANVYSRYNAFYYDLQSPTAGSFIDNFVVFFNTSCKWSTSFGLNMYNNRLLSYLSPSSDASISVSIHPLPVTKNQSTLLNSLTSVIVAIGFAFMPANFIAYAVREQEIKVKHQQLISGVSAASYWAANFVYDFLNYMIMGLLCMIIFSIWDIEPLIGENSGATLVVIIFYGLSIIPFNYCASFLFTESTSAQNSMLLFYIFAGAILLIAIIVLSLIESTKDAAYYLRFICRLLPSFSFGEAIGNIITRTSTTIYGSTQGLWSMNVTGYPLLYMAIEFLVYSIFVLVYEKVKATPDLMTKIFGNPNLNAPNAPDDDADVINERTRLQSGQGSNDMISVKGLRKVYAGRLGGGNKIAVQDLWMGIPEGQCFGYLGINGAGKTTTLKMLTGDIIPTSGTATLNGLDILTHQNDVRALLGYCPQFDALLERLTAREHLILFARIKGVPEDIIPDYVEHLIIKIGLQEGIADKPTGGYSGGNKRKISVGMALIGNPPIVFLDEPSTGMDPGSRRFMWDLISSTMKNRSVILTTHSMEECEALCHRIGIMVGGRLRCLGSTTHLKSVYGNGLQIDINVAEIQHETFKERLMQTWEGVTIIEQHGNSFKFRIPRECNGQRTTIGQVFRFIENIKAEFGIQEYACSETSLEQIFIHFAKQQEEETGHVAGIN